MQLPGSRFFSYVNEESSDVAVVYAPLRDPSARQHQSIGEVLINIASYNASNKKATAATRGGPTSSAAATSSSSFFLRMNSFVHKMMGIILDGLKTLRIHIEEEKKDELTSMVADGILSKMNVDIVEDSEFLKQQKESRERLVGQWVVVQGLQRKESRKYEFLSHYVLVAPQRVVHLLRYVSARCGRSATCSTYPVLVPSCGDVDHMSPPVHF